MYFLDKELNQKISMIKVNSSNICLIGYFASRLYIHFKETSLVYRYNKVSQSLYNKLINAKSKGSFLSQNIKKFPEKYPYKKLKGEIYAC